jgi:hypothetical protein
MRPRRAITLGIGLFAFVFVVVCPFTDTPTAVSKVSAPLVALIVIPILTAPLALATLLPDWERPLFTPESRLDSLCVRLC